MSPRPRWCTVLGHHLGRGVQATPVPPCALRPYWTCPWRKKTRASQKHRGLPCPSRPPSRSAPPLLRRRRALACPALLRLPRRCATARAAPHRLPRRRATASSPRRVLPLLRFPRGSCPRLPASTSRSTCSARPVTTECPRPGQSRSVVAGGAAPHHADRRRAASERRGGVRCFPRAPFTGRGRGRSPGGCQGGSGSPSSPRRASWGQARGRGLAS